MKTLKTSENERSAHSSACDQNSRVDSEIHNTPKRRIIAENFALEMAPIFDDIRKKGARTLQEVADELNNQGIKTSYGRNNWTVSNVRLIDKNIRNVRQKGTSKLHDEMIRFMDSQIKLVDQIKKTDLENPDEIAEMLNSIGSRTVYGTLWSPESVRRMNAYLSHSTN